MFKYGDRVIRRPNVSPDFWAVRSNMPPDLAGATFVFDRLDLHDTGFGYFLTAEEYDSGLEYVGWRLLLADMVLDKANDVTLEVDDG